MLKTSKYTLRIIPLFYSVTDVRVEVKAGYFWRELSEYRRFGVTHCIFKLCFLY